MRRASAMMVLHHLCILALLSAGSSPARAQSLESFGYGRMTVSGTQARGQRPLLVILTHFAGSPALAHTRDEFDAMFFNPFTKGVNGYFIACSHGRFSWKRAGQGIYGPYEYAANQFDHWPEVKPVPLQRLGLALASVAADGLDFSQFDSNGNGVVTSDELGVMVIDSVTGEDASTRGPNPASFDNHGVKVQLNQVARVGHRGSMMSFAHELSHLLGTVELYGTAMRESFGYTLMGSTMFGIFDDRTSFLLDPWHKLLLGWTEPQIHNLDVDGSASITTARRGDPIILYSPAHGPLEYFLAELRTRDSVGGMDYDSDVTDAGLVLWHVKTKGRGGEDVNGDLEVIPSAAFAGQQMVSVHVLGAPGMLRGSGRAWSSGVIPYPLTWADGTSIPLRLDVAPLQDGGDRVTLAWGNFPSTRLPIASRKVFYYSRGEASAQVGTIDARFEPATLSTYAPGQFGSWSHIVGNATELFFYNMQSGQTALGEVDADGRFTTKSTQDGFKAGWTNIVRHNGYLFFYDRGTGTGTVGLFKGGRFTELNRWENGFSAGWTHVVSTPGGLLFYNASSGAAVVGDWDLVKGGDGPRANPFSTGPIGEIVRVDFRERQRYPPGALRGGWTQIVATTDGVLFYNGSDGRAVLADVRDSGIIDTRPQTESTLERGWTHVVAVNEQVLFYNRTSGEAALGTTLIRTMQGDSTKPLLRGSLIMRRTYAGVFPSNLSHIVTTVDPAPSPQ